MDGDAFIKVLDIIESLAVIAGVVAVFLAFRAYRTATKQTHHGVMISCIERFQSIIPDLDSPDKEKKLDALRKYVDLCNEELFYFKGDYVPHEVATEWLDGMIRYLPLFNTRGDVLSKGKFPEILEHDMLADYPRIRKAFSIPCLPEMEDPDNRKLCIEGIIGTVKKLSYPCS